jgi:hypothetical protein
MVIRIQADVSRGGDFSALCSCSCPSYTQDKNKCKHLFLASRITGLPIHPPPRVAPLDAGPHVHPAGTAVLAPVPPLTGALSAEDAAAQKHALIDTIQKEVDAASARVQRLMGMPLEKLSRAALSALGDTATRLRRDLNEVISNAPLYAFLM